MFFATSSSRQQELGFTAIELLVVIAIVAILAALAAPNFNGLMERWRVRSAVEELQSTLYFTRSEAIRRAADIEIIKNSNGNGCTTAGDDHQWGCGWSVSTADGSSTLQQTGAPTRVEIEVTDDSSGSAVTSGTINVNRWGQFSNGGSNSLAFRLWPAGTSSSNTAAASLCLKPSGQLKRLNTGDGSC
ncbi:MAG: GspH/FimT family pseudopilin [Comamonas sp.]